MLSKISTTASTAWPYRGATVERLGAFERSTASSADLIPPKTSSSMPSSAGSISARAAPKADNVSSLRLSSPLPAASNLTM